MNLALKVLKLTGHVLAKLHLLGKCVNTVSKDMMELPVSTVLQVITGTKRIALVNLNPKEPIHPANVTLSLQLANVIQKVHWKGKQMGHASVSKATKASSVLLVKKACTENIYPVSQENAIPWARKSGLELAIVCVSQVMPEADVTSAPQLSTGLNKVFASMVDVWPEERSTKQSMGPVFAILDTGTCGAINAKLSTMERYVSDVTWVTSGTAMSARDVTA